MVDRSTSDESTEGRAVDDRSTNGDSTEGRAVDDRSTSHDLSDVFASLAIRSGEHVFSDEVMAVLGISSSSSGTVFKLGIQTTFEEPDVCSKQFDLLPLKTPHKKNIIFQPVKIMEHIFCQLQIHSKPELGDR